MDAELAALEAAGTMADLAVDADAPDHSGARLATVGPSAAVDRLVVARRRRGTLGIVDQLGTRRFPTAAPGSDASAQLASIGSVARRVRARLQRVPPETGGSRALDGDGAVGETVTMAPRSRT